MLSPALMPLAEYQQFILWKKTRQDSKLTKEPIDYKTGIVSDAHNSKIWTDLKTIVKTRNERWPHFGIGFVLTKNDPFFLLDIDHDFNTETQQWSTLARKLCDQFSGAAIEVSSSFEGLHIIGSLSHKPDHKTRPENKLNFELYTHARFIAIADINTVGDVNHNCDKPLQSLIEEYFTPVSPTITTPHTHCPRADWRGPTDDEGLLRRALQSTSMRGAFGHATFKQLWEADAALAQSYPSPTGYNESDADAALAQHLAFWTGADYDRIHRLMLRSGLVREKWRREDYLPRTIAHAVSVCDRVLQDKPTEPYKNNLQNPTNKPQLISGSTFLTLDQQSDFFAGHVYVADAHAVFAPPGKLYAPARYSAYFAGWTFCLDSANQKTTRDAWKVILESQAIKIPRVHTTVFRPNLGTGVVITQQNGTTAVNIYCRQQVLRMAGDISPFLYHISKLLPDPRDQQIILSYMAACVQHQGKKFRWCVLIQGVDGNGKTLLGECVAEAIGTDYVTNPPAATITAEFNGWMYNKILVLVEDVYISESPTAVVEALKPIIDRPRQNIQMKYQESTARDICCNFMLNSNHKDAIRKTENDRRFCIFYTAQQTVADLKRDGLDESTGYFSGLIDWLKNKNGHAIINEFLYTYEIPEMFNPAGECHRAPETSSTYAAITESRSPVEQEIIEAVEQQLIGFRGGWISSHYLNELLKQSTGRKMSLIRRKEMLRQLGYVPHPGLLEGRATGIVMPDGVRSRLFVHVKSEFYNLTEPTTVVTAYSKSQNL